MRKIEKGKNSEIGVISKKRKRNEKDEGGGNMREKCSKQERRKLW